LLDRDDPFFSFVTFISFFWNISHATHGNGATGKQSSQGNTFLRIENISGIATTNGRGATSATIVQFPSSCVAKSKSALKQEKKTKGGQTTLNSLCTTTTGHL